jgi:exodeoxyribonuclease V gamma subunit
LLVDNSRLFSESWIIIPNHSAKLWLQKSLARDLGVCSQIKFIMPLSFNWEIIKNVTHSKYDHNVFSVDVLTWKIYQIIHQDAAFSSLKKDSLLSQFNLSEKLARTFLKYTDEHPQLINEWDENRVKQDNLHQWQSQLWLKILNQLSEHSPVALLKKFNPDTDFNKDPAQIILFATEQLTTLQAETISKLAQKQDIHLMLSNPSPEIYWFDLVSEKQKQRKQYYHPKSNEMLEVGNPLLASLGRLKMSLFDTFLNTETEAIELASQSVDHQTTLLQSLVKDIYFLQETPLIHPLDHSISVHSCHNKTREIEVIQDQILNHLNTKTSLNPEDIIVLAPDINDYVAPIHQAFASNSTTIALPYHIDRRRLADANYIVALMALIESFSKEMTATTIFQLLTNQTILEKFNLSPEELPRIKTWITDSNIRNYYNAEEKANLGFESKIGNTWKFGERRWLTGYLSGEENDLEYLSTFGDIAGQESLFQSLFNFLDLWQQTKAKVAKNQSPQDWFKIVKTICTSFLYNDFKFDFEDKILKQLEHKFIKQTLDCSELVPLVVIHQIVEKVITENNYRSEGQIGIRFQSWENAFIADAKLLILIGLNDKEFPKNEIKNDLDIYQNQPAKLNKSVRLRDKNLMLSALTEGTENLIISYIGFSDKNNEAQAPSILVSELVSYLQVKTNNEFQIHQHKMHGFNQDYFNAEATARSYNQKNYSLAQSFYSHKSHKNIEEITLMQDMQQEIPLRDLIQFFIDPLQYFLKHRAQLNPSIYADKLKDIETYHPDAIEKWHLKQILFESNINQAHKTGIISDNKVGEQITKNLNANLQALLETKAELKLTPSLVDINLFGVHVFGTVNVDNEGRLVSIYPKQFMLSAKQICEHWIQHLCYHPQQPSIIYFEDNIQLLFPVVSEMIRKHYFEYLIEKWKLSFQQAWLFNSPSWINIKTSSVGLSSHVDYLKKMDPNSHSNHPSQGQIYFSELVAKHDCHEDVVKLIEPIVNSIEVIK